MPIVKLRRLLVRWVRLDLPVEQMDREHIMALVQWYKGLPQLWILPQRHPDPLAAVQLMLACGITEIEPGNEPEDGKYNPGGKPWSGATYGAWFAAIRKVVGRRARLYGPANAVYHPDFVKDAIAAGMKADGITFHGYGSPNLNLDAADCTRRFGLQVVISEDGTPEGVAPASWWQTRGAQMGNRPWCWYDGPDTCPAGLFSRAPSDQWPHLSMPTLVYATIAGTSDSTAATN